MKMLFDELKGFKEVLEYYNKEYNNDVSVIEGLNHINFITSLVLLNKDVIKLRENNLFTVAHKNRRDIEIIASIKLYLGKIDKIDILNNLNTNIIKYPEIHIVIVSWKEFISLNQEIISETYEGLDIENSNYKLIIHNMGYKTFIENINEICKFKSSIEDSYLLGINPIIIFQGLHWGNIIYLLKLYGFVIHGGSISRRHKLSISEYKLSQFLYLSQLSNSKYDFYQLYIEKYLSSNKYDANFYNYLKRKGNIITYSHEIPYILEYFKINNKIYVSNKLLDIKNKILNITNLKIETESKITVLESTKEFKLEQENNIKLMIYKLNKQLNELKSSNRAKSKISLSGRIKKLNIELLELKNNKIKLDQEISNLLNNLDSLPEKISNLVKEKDNLDETMKSYSESKSKVSGNINGNGKIINNCYRSNGINRQYHTLKRFYSISSRKINFSIDSPIYLELQRIITNSQLDYQTQLKIENFLMNQGSFILDQRLNEILDINYHKLNYNILNYIKSSIISLDILINNYRKKLNIKNNLEYVNEEYELFNNLENEFIISILLGRVLRIISNNNIINKNTISINVAIDLGKDLIYHYCSIKNASTQINSSIEKSYDKSLNSFMNDKKRNNLYNVFNDDKFLFNIGIILISFLQEVNLIKFNVVQISKDQKQTILIPVKDISDKLDHQLILFNLSYKIPMIVKPNNYGRNLKTNEDILGGYLLNDKKFINPLIIKNSELKDQSFIEVNNNNIYNMVNNISSVAFKINNQVLDFILNYGLKYNLIIDPNFVHPLEIKKDKKKLTMNENKELGSFLSKKYLEMNILGLAHIFKNVVEFYIPVRIDNRGRVYCMADYLNYQSTELAKALLLFSKGEKIYKSNKNSINYLKIFGANCFGNGIDKKSFFDRVNWVEDNEDNILNFRNGILIDKADSKLLFIAFCFEYINYKNSLNNNETYYISHFPIQLDATCNGYQHLSLLTNDDSLASILNLFPADEKDIPNDFYSFVGIKLTEYFKQQILNLQKLENNSLEIDSYKKLAKLDIHRKLVKLPIMVKPYNASLFQMVNYIKEQFEEISLENINIKNNINNIISSSNLEINKKYYIHKDNKDIILNNKDFYVLTSSIEKILYTEFPKLKEFNIYLKKVADICSILNISITWVLPTGLNVSQYYVDSEAIRLKPFTYKKNTFNLLIKKNKLNKPKQIRALMPNLIHSLDASSLALVVEMFFQDNFNNYSIKNFYSIHDCFAVTANNIENLIKIVKLVYIKIYSDDKYLRKFDEGIINSIKLHYGKDSFDDKLKLIKINDMEIKYPNVEEIILGEINKKNIMESKYIIN